jgi:hypothetical protein
MSEPVTFANQYGLAVLLRTIFFRFEPYADSDTIAVCLEMAATCMLSNNVAIIVDHVFTINFHTPMY